MKCIKVLLIALSFSLGCNAQLVDQICLNSTTYFQYYVGNVEWPIEGYEVVYEGGDGQFETWDRLDNDGYIKVYFTPHAYARYKIYYKRKLFGAPFEKELMQEYETFLPNLTLNTTITGDPITHKYVASALTSISMEPGFYAEASSALEFATYFKTCPALRIGEFSSSDKVVADHIENVDDVFSVYPNPNKVNLLGLNIKGDLMPGNVVIYSSNGSIVLEKKILNSEEIIGLGDSMKPGVYLVSFISDLGKILNEKLIIE